MEVLMGKFPEGLWLIFGICRVANGMQWDPEGSTLGRSESEFLQQAPSSIDGVAGVLTGLKDAAGFGEHPRDLDQRGV